MIYPQVISIKYIYTYTSFFMLWLGDTEGCVRPVIDANWSECSIPQRKTAETHYALHSNFKDFYWTYVPKATIMNVWLQEVNLSGFSSQPCRRKEVSQHPIEKSVVGEHVFMNSSLQIFQYYFSDSGINSKRNNNIDLNKWIE